MDVKLVMFKPDGQRKEFEVRRDTSSIGRAEDCTFRVPLLNVSRKHCELILGEDELRVRDLASSNGTYVNNRRINETALKAGDRLMVGPVVFTLQVDGEPAEITPIRTKVQQVPEPASASEASGELDLSGLPGGDDEEIVELEPDEVADLSAAGAGESDPIAALEALAEQGKEKEGEEKQD